MRSCERIDEWIRSFILKLKPQAIKFLAILVVLPQIFANFVLNLLILQVSLAIQIFSLDKAVQLFFWTLQKDNIGGNLFILLNSYNITDSQFFPGCLFESTGFEHMSYRIVDFFIRYFPFQIFEKILDSRHSHNKTERNKNHRKTSWICDRRNHLHNSNNQKVNVRQLWKLYNQIERDEVNYIVLIRFDWVIGSLWIRLVRNDRSIRHLSIGRLCSEQKALLIVSVLIGHVIIKKCCHRIQIFLVITFIKLYIPYSCCFCKDIKTLVIMKQLWLCLYDTKIMHLLFSAPIAFFIDQVFFPMR